jgi:hypothetical protein
MVISLRYVITYLLIVVDEISPKIYTYMYCLVHGNNKPILYPNTSFVKNILKKTREIIGSQYFYIQSNKNSTKISVLIMRQLSHY